MNFHHLIAETASPGPEVSVPTLGSWKYDDLICKIPKNNLGGAGFFLPCTGQWGRKTVNKHERKKRIWRQSGRYMLRI